MTRRITRTRITRSIQRIGIIRRTVMPEPSNGRVANPVRIGSASILGARSFKD